MDIATEPERHDVGVVDAYMPAPEGGTGGHFGFGDVLARTLPRLAMTAVPIRVLAVSSDDAGAAALVMRLRAVLEPKCEIAAIDARTAGVLCYAPTVSPRASSEARLGGCGLLARLRPIASARPLDIRALDLSSVACAGAGDILMALRRAPVRRLTGKARAALAA